jgi:hypothetical protein
MLHHQLFQSGQTPRSRAKPLFCLAYPHSATHAATRLVRARLAATGLGAAPAARQAYVVSVSALHLLALANAVHA